MLLRHVHNVQDLSERFSIDDRRLFNLYETSMSAERDCHGSTRKKAIVPIGFRCNVQSAHFQSNLSRVTLFVTVCASGEFFLPL